jgi:hypothetical protein
MMRKLIVFCFALLTLGVLLTVPAPVAGSCPPTCPCDYPDTEYYCDMECANAGYGFYTCYNECISGCVTTDEYLCSHCGMCCYPEY